MYKSIYVYRSQQHRLDILDRIFQGEKAFIFSSTFTVVMYENFYRANYDSLGYPLTRIKDRQAYIQYCLSTCCLSCKNLIIDIHIFTDLATSTRLSVSRSTYPRQEKYHLP